MCDYRDGLGVCAYTCVCGEDVSVYMWGEVVGVCLREMQICVNV